MTVKQKCECEQICKHYGIESQKMLLMEECAELIQTVSKLTRAEQSGKVFETTSAKLALVEEMADVHIMIEQVLRHYWQDGDGKLDYFIDEKLTRQLGRIESEGTRSIEKDEKFEFEIDDSVLEKINRFTRKPLTKDRLYCFPLVLSNNEVDSDNEYFTAAALEKLAELFVGKAGVFNHYASGMNQTARIFDTELVKDESALTSLGEPLISLTARAYMVRAAYNRDLIDEIDAGIKKEVSISCSVAKKVCSICGANIYKNPCSHIKGRNYGGKKCVYALEEPYDAYEWSFVEVPVQKKKAMVSASSYDDEVEKYEDK